MAKVTWTRRAQEYKNKILLYGLMTFGETSAKRLNCLFEKYCVILSNNPYIGREEQQLKGIGGCSYRSVLIHKNYRLVYRVEDSATGKEEEIVIVYVLDTRSNPETFSERIREAVDSIVAGAEESS